MGRPAGMLHQERAESLTEDGGNKIINKNDSSCKTPDFLEKAVVRYRQDKGTNGGHRKYR